MRIFTLIALLLAATPAIAQMPPAPGAPPAAQAEPLPPPPPYQPPADVPPPPPAAAPTPSPGTAPGGYRRDDVIGAAEGVFGRGAEGLGTMIEKILKDQGQPVGYIAGREASGALGIGLRYGSGTLTLTPRPVPAAATPPATANPYAAGTAPPPEATITPSAVTAPVYWTGPSLGFDVGGDATKVFVLVYNLDEPKMLYKRFVQVEGRAYFIGGFSATYLRRGNVVLIPVRAGVGVRLGANIGYMKFSEKSRLLPF